MSREFVAALTFLGLIIAGLIVFLCKLAWSGVKGKSLDESCDREAERQYKMRASRNER